MVIGMYGRVVTQANEEKIPNRYTTVPAPLSPVWNSIRLNTNPQTNETEGGGSFEGKADCRSLEADYFGEFTLLRNLHSLLVNGAVWMQAWCCSVGAAKWTRL